MVSKNILREFETVCIEEQKQSRIYAHFCFALTGALLTKTNCFCQVKNGNWPSENWKLHFTWSRMCCKSWVAILREAVSLQWGWIEPHLFKVADQGQGCTLCGTKINLNLLSVDLVRPSLAFSKPFLGFSGFLFGQIFSLFSTPKIMQNTGNQVVFVYSAPVSTKSQLSIQNVEKARKFKTYQSYK